MQTRLLLAFALIIASAGAWMDPAWQYRTPVTVSNGGSALADYQVSVTLNTNALILAGKMRSDCGDLRFANSTDNSLPFWVETGTCNTASTKAWVRLPYIPGGSSTIYAYYGNAAAAGASSGTATFPFFDDFNRPNGVVGNGWTEYHSGGNAVYAIVSNVLHVTDSTGFNEWISKPATLPSDFSLEMNVLSFPSPSNDAEIITGVGGTLFNWLSLDNYPQGSNTRINGVYQNLGGLTTGRWKITKVGTTWRFYNGLDQNRGSYTINIGTATTIYIASFGSSESFDIDDFRVRNYASTEPTTSPQAEQARPTVIFAGISPASVASYPNTQQNFTLWVYSNQTSADSIALSCTGTCYYSENPVAVSAQQNKSVTVTVPTASVSGTTNYQITAVSQANALNNATASFSITVDATTWRSKWTDAFNNTYAYRAPITISNNGSALTDYQVPVNLANLIYNNTGLVGSWHFSEGSGTRAADSSGSGNDGTLLNGPAWAAGKFGGGLSFDGANDYAAVASSASLNPGKFTVAAWIKTGSPADSFIVDKWGSDTGYALWVLGSKITLTVNYYLNRVSGNTTVTDGAWHYAVATHDGQTMRIYVDGNLDGTLALAQDAVSTAFDLNLGRYRQSNAYYFNGTIDEVRVYNRALPTQEIQQLYSASKLRLDYADLRFANSSISQLPYWLESDNRAWAKVPYVPNGTSTIYAYYGSPAAQSAANGNATFDFFDDFSGDLGKWTVNGVSITSGYAAIATTGTGWGNYMYSNMSFDRSSMGYELTLSHRIKGTTWNQHETYMGFGSAASGPLVQPKEAWNQAGQTNGGNNYNLGWSDAGGTGVVASGSPSIANLWKRFTVRINQGSGGLLSTDVTPVTYTLTGADNNMRVKVNAYMGGADVDDVRVRKYASPEPSGALLLEEPANPAAMLGILPPGKTTYPNYNETFTLWVYNNQTVSDTFTLSCAGTCSVSPALLALTPYQNGSANVTITSANASGTTAYAITATSQANASNSVGIFASITVDATKWRDTWSDAYNNGFRYRIPVTINNTGSALTDYQVDITIDSATPIGLSRMRSDCGDIRITNGTNEMPYWIESGCNSPSTRIWARVPYVPAGNSTVYAYYGNPSTAYNNSLGGKNTFYTGADVGFDSSAGWGHGGAGSAIAVNAALSGLYFTNLARNSVEYEYANLSKGVGNFTFDFTYRYTSGSSGTPQVCLSDALANNCFGGNAVGARIDNPAGNALYLFTCAVGACSTSLVLVWNSTAVAETGYYRIRFNGTAAVLYLWLNDSTRSGIPDATYTKTTNIPAVNMNIAYAISGNMDTFSATSSGWVDSVLVRSYASPEPSALAGAEQSKGYRTLVRRCGLVQPNATVTAYQANASIGSCVSNTYGICALEIGAGIYDLQFTFADSSTAWKYGTVFS